MNAHVIRQTLKLPNPGRAYKVLMARSRQWNAESVEEPMNNKTALAKPRSNADLIQDATTELMELPPYGDRHGNTNNVLVTILTVLGDLNDRVRDLERERDGEM